MIGLDTFSGAAGEFKLNDEKSLMKNQTEVLTRGMFKKLLKIVWVTAKKNQFRWATSSWEKICKNFNG